MRAMNNWLGFSLTPHEQHQQQQQQQQQDPSHHHHHHQNAVVSRMGFNNSDELSGDCAFDLTSSPSPLNNPFGILEAFNRNNPNHDWNMKGFDGNYKSSENSMLMADHNHHQHQSDEQPKLENFLGTHSFSDQEQKLHGCTAIYDTTTAGGGDYMFHHQHQSNTNDHARTISSNDNNNNNSSSLGLSMIKTWLRNQPPPPQQPTAAETKNGVGGGSAQSLSLSMGTGSSLPLLNASSNNSNNNNNNMEQQQKTTPPPATTATVAAGVDSPNGAVEAVPRKSIDTFGQRTSIYRGVTRHRWTGRYEAHLWDNSCRREGQTRKGRQVYLGGYDKEDKAARAYDLAALKYWGSTTTTNFPISNYEKELEEMKHMTRQEYVASLRRKSSGFSRGASIYRGVTRHHQHGRWQARIGRVAGNKDLYLGTFSTQEEAAEAYDIAAIKFRGLNAVTNFDMSRYDVKSILESSTLPIGGAAKRLKDVESPSEILMPIDNLNGQRSIITNTTATQDHEEENITSQLTTVDGINGYHHNGWPTNIAFQHLSSPAVHHHQNLIAMQYHHHHHPYANSQARVWCKQEQDSDHHQLLQLGNINTHNFFQQPSSVLHNLMSMETTPSSMQEHSSAGSNSSVIYNGGGDNGNGGYMIPMGMGSGNDHQNMFSSSSTSSSDPFNHHQRWSSSPSVMKASAYDNNNWVPTAIPTSTNSTNIAAAVCHGAAPFTVWNDT